MPSIYDLKPRFQALLNPFVGAIANRGITANQITLSAVGLSLVEGLWIACAPHSSLPLLLLPLVLLVRMGLNAIDGMLARNHGQQSKLGAILNELGDVVSDTLLYLPMALLAPVSAPLMVGIVLLSVISEMTGVVAIQIGAQRQYAGPMGKSDRAVAFGTLGFFMGMGMQSVTFTTILLAIVLFLLIRTIFNRANAALRDTHDA